MFFVHNRLLNLSGLGDCIEPQRPGLLLFYGVNVSPGSVLRGPLENATNYAVHRLGLTFTQLFSHLFAKKETLILMVGLDAAGKTTILYKLKLGEIVTTILPLDLTWRLLSIKTSASLSGMLGVKTRHYLQNTWGLIFVVDSNDRDRVVEARHELHRMLNEGKDKTAEERRIAICIFDIVAEQCCEAALSDWLVIGSLESIEYLC